MTEEFDVYPILHRGNVYNIITKLDLTFAEVRALIDRLADLRAFEETEEDLFMGPGKLFSLEIDNVRYDVDVQGFEVVVYTREEL